MIIIQTIFLLIFSGLSILAWFTLPNKQDGIHIIILCAIGNMGLLWFVMFTVKEMRDRLYKMTGMTPREYIKHIEKTTGKPYKVWLREMELKEIGKKK